MPIRIRLRRMGAKKRPFYRIVVAESKMPRDGRFIEEVGYYNPLVEPMVVNLKEERIYSWLERGAQPTETVRSLLKKVGLWAKWGIRKSGGDTSEIEIVTQAPGKKRKMKPKEGKPPQAVVEAEPITPSEEEKAVEQAKEDTSGKEE